jgi:hypothetical protein
MKETTDLSGRQPTRIEARQEVERDGARVVRKSSLELSGIYNQPNKDLIPATRLLISLQDPYSVEPLADMDCSELLEERKRAVRYLASVDQEILRKAYEAPDGLFYVDYASEMATRAGCSSDSEAMP